MIRERMVTIKLLIVLIAGCGDILFGDDRSITEQQQAVIKTVNQEPEVFEDGYSDVDHKLEIGKYGDYMTFDENGDLEVCRVAIEKLYTGDKAERLLKKCLKEEGRVYEPAKLGTSWHVVKYSLSDSPESKYTNICLRGLDGGRLTYNGIKYSKRTKDLFAGIKTAGEGYGGLYCYYMVPNGCKEYMLEVGERNGTGKSTACYYINVFQGSRKD